METGIAPVDIIPTMNAVGNTVLNTAAVLPWKLKTGTAAMPTFVTAESEPEAVCAETAARPPAIRAPVTAVGATVNCVPLAEVDAVRTVRATPLGWNTVAVVTDAPEIEAKVPVFSMLVMAKLAALLTNEISAVPALLRTEASPVVPTEPTNEPADNPPEDIAPKVAEVMPEKISSPYSDTDQFVLEAEKLTRFPITYSPAVRLLLAKVIG